MCLRRACSCPNSEASPKPLPSKNGIKPDKDNHLRVRLDAYKIIFSALRKPKAIRSLYLYRRSYLVRDFTGRNIGSIFHHYNIIVECGDTQGLTLGGNVTYNLHSVLA